MKLMTKELAKKIPKLYEQEYSDNPIAYCKFFTPDSNWTWYVLEYDGEDICFGYVIGFESELGYFSISELEEVTGPSGLKIERDKFFEPTPLHEIKEGR